MNTIHLPAYRIGATRIAGIMLAVVLAAAAGVATGTAIQQLTAQPAETSQTAQAQFSVAAIAELQALRGDPGAAAWVDYGVRHLAAPKAYDDYGVRHPAIVGGQAEGTTDTFRLTGPSQLEDEVVLRRQAR